MLDAAAVMPNPAGIAMLRVVSLLRFLIRVAVTVAPVPPMVYYAAIATLAVKAARISTAISVAVVCAVVSVTGTVSGEPATDAAVNTTLQIPLLVTPDAATTVAVSTWLVPVTVPVTAPVARFSVMVSPSVMNIFSEYAIFGGVA